MSTHYEVAFWAPSGFRRISNPGSFISVKICVPKELYDAIGGLLRPKYAAVIPKPTFLVQSRPVAKVRLRKGR